LEIDETQPAAKLAAKSLGIQEASLAQVFERQTELLSKTLRASAAPRTSKIRAELKVAWPRLGDDRHGGREVEEFDDKVEEIFGLANDGRGMVDQESLVAPKSCLQGS
jgi:hypothetical protein